MFHWTSNLIENSIICSCSLWENSYYGRWIENLISDLMVSMLYSGVSDHGFELRLGQTKDYNWYLLLLHQAHSTNE